MPSLAPLLDHPAETELFGQALTCQAVLPVQFTVGERPLMQQQAEAMLSGLAVAEDSRGEDPDDRGEVPQSMQRLEAKLDLIVSLLGKLVSQQSTPLPVRPLRWSHLGLRIDADAPSGARPGDLGIVKLQPVAWLGDTIELPVRVLAILDNTNGGQHLWLRFGMLTAGLEDALTRHLFRMHRRQVAEARQVANELSNSDSRLDPGAARSRDFRRSPLSLFSNHAQRHGQYLLCLTKSYETTGLSPSSWYRERLLNGAQLHVRLLIVDDHTLVRAGITRLLQGLPDIDVVAEASNAREALDMAAIHRPDVILLDLSLPDRNGLDLLQPLKESLPLARVVIMSMHCDEAQIRTALDRGCAGFVVKEAAPMELELALRAAMAGQVFLSPQVSSRMIGSIGNGRPSGVQALSPRQREILRDLANGMSSKEIAVHMGISVKTVETHRARMMESLGCRRANELLLLAARYQRNLA